MSDYLAPQDMYTAEEAAALFRVHTGTIRRWARAGKLGRFVRPGEGAYRFPRINIHHALAGGTFDQEGNLIP